MQSRSVETDDNLADLFMDPQLPKWWTRGGLPGGESKYTGVAVKGETGQLLSLRVTRSLEPSAPDDMCVCLVDTGDSLLTGVQYLTDLLEAIQK